MGKRKSSARKPAKKIKQVLDTQFSCLFCNHEKSVICSLDKKSGVGELHCKICGQTFQSKINSLSQPVDIYSDWIDACEELAEKDDVEKTMQEEQKGRISEVVSDDEEDDNY